MKRVQVHAISNIVAVLADRGDSVVVDEFAYVHVTECILTPRGLNLIPVSGNRGRGRGGRAEGGLAEPR